MIFLGAFAYFFAVRAKNWARGTAEKTAGAVVAPVPLTRARSEPAVGVGTPTPD